MSRGSARESSCAATLDLRYDTSITHAYHRSPSDGASRSLGLPQPVGC